MVDDQQVFGFVALVVTLLDGVLIGLLSAAFASLPFEAALWAAVAVYGAHAILEAASLCLVRCSAAADRPRGGSVSGP